MLHRSCPPFHSEMRAETHCKTEMTSVLTRKPKTATIKMRPKEPVVMAEGRESLALCCNDEMNKVLEQTIGQSAQR